MIGLLPLILLYLASRTTRAASPAVVRTTAPQWPTPASPPPMPAFQALPTASADPSHSSTPLADLHNNPPQIAPSKSATKRHAVAKRSSQIVKRGGMSLSLLKGKLESSVPVAKLQQILVSRGAKLSRDGLYGPRTASAWSKLASSKRLPSTITRVGPKVAKVVTQTYESLSVPAIP
jgi:hypothetical protein